jgi:hypothetical protein
MSDGIVVSGGGSVVVASDALLTELDRIDQLTRELLTSGHRMAALAENTGGQARHCGPQVQAACHDAMHRLNDAQAKLTLAARRTHGLHSALQFCLTAYGEVEREVDKQIRRASSAAAYSIGVALPVLAVPIVSSLLVSEGVIVAVTHLSLRQQGAMAQAFLKKHNRLISNPVTVRVLREVMMDTDEFGEGLLRMPPVLTQLLGDNGARKLGLPSSAATVALIGGAFGLVKETPVSVSRTSSQAGVLPPTSILERAERIPVVSADGNQSQIRIDRYSQPGQPDTFDVYIGGTVTFDPHAATQPFDITSDIAGVAQQPAGSYRAVVDAMHAAGITSSSPVVLNGYSQGGLVASMVAASDQFTVHGVVTFGAPAGQIAVPAHVPVLELRHTEDIVPALGGDDSSDRAVIVRRSVFAEQPIPAGIAVPAHRLGYYEQTADLVDHATSAKLTQTVRSIDDFTAQTGVTTTWQATRVAVPATAGG